MKKLVVLFILAALMLPYQSALAIVQSSVAQDDVVPPNWEEYVPEKYKNPRMFSRGKSIGELATGILLTDLLFTAPIGIPMIVHSTTKLKNIGYYNKKIMFDNGLAEAAQINDPVERQRYYDNLITECKFNPKHKARYDKKAAKEAIKNKNKK